MMIPAVQMPTKKKVGLIGARGYVGRELLALLEGDPTLDVAFVSSKGGAGRLAGEAIGVGGRFASLLLEDLEPARAARRCEDEGIDAIVLGLPNGQAASWVAALPAHVAVVDLSADHRFDDRWVYGLVERDRARLKGATRIANPGCYATATQLALWPFADVVERAHVFGLSGWSGAGTSPSPKNDTKLLADNVLPYDLVGHTQEKELRRHTGVDVRFFPHVAPFFRGITVTVAMDLKQAVTKNEALARLRERYAHEPLVAVVEGELPPLVTQARERHGCLLGGVDASVDERRVVVVACIDNLLKGAATQALQNVHLALGLDERAGIPLGATTAEHAR
jgi:N-acetyl-gamma-glutamyl-phosphate reductase common form